MQCAPRNVHLYLGNAVTGITYYHVLDDVQRSLRPDLEYAAFSNYMTDIESSLTYRDQPHYQRRLRQRLIMPRLTPQFRRHQALSWTN